LRNDAIGGAYAVGKLALQKTLREPPLLEKTRSTLMSSPGVQTHNSDHVYNDLLKKGIVYQQLIICLPPISTLTMLKLWARI
jgi:hypothetical protein